MSTTYNGKLLARLIHSIGTRRGDRPLLPMEVSDGLLHLLDGDDSPAGRTRLGRRFKVSGMTIKEFLDLQKAPDRFRDVWGWGGVKDGRVPWSQFREACDFYHKGIITEDELGILVNGVLDESIKPDNVREIIRLKKKSPAKSFETCCRELANTVPETIKSVLFISDLDPGISKSIRQRAREKSVSNEGEAERVLSEYVGRGNVEGVVIQDGMRIKIAFTEEGRKKLGDLMKKYNEPTRYIINNLFTRAGYSERKTE